MTPLEAQQIQQVAKLALREARHNDLARFIVGRNPHYKMGWVHREVCDALNKLVEAVEQSRPVIYQINLPFRHGKSDIASVNLPAYIHGRTKGTKRIILASYAQSLSNKFSRQARSIIASDYFQDIFPDCKLSKDRKAVQEWELTGGGGFKAVGVGGGVTGHGADLIIVDDVYKGFEQADSVEYRQKIEEWWKTELGTRKQPGASILILNTRWNENDFNTFIAEEATQNGIEMVQISYPAIAEEDEPHRKKGEALHPIRYPLEVLQQWQRSMGAYRWRALGQQRPIPPGGEIFKRDLLRYWTTRDGIISEPHQGDASQRAPLRIAKYLDPDTWDHCFERVTLSVDCSFKKTEDGSTVALLVGGKIGSDGFVLDCVWEAMTFTETLAKILEMCQLWNPDQIFIEDKANGSAVMDMLRSKIPGIIPVEPRGSKEARAHACSGVVEAGNIYLPHPDDSAHNAKWVGDFVRLLCGFPKIRPDDPVDAFTQWASREIVRAFTYRIGGALAPGNDHSTPTTSMLPGFLPEWSL